LDTLQFSDYLEFQRAKLTVAYNQKVTTAAGRVKKTEFRYFEVKLVEGVVTLRAVLVGLDYFKLFVQFIQEQGLNEFQDVLLAGVVRTEVAAFLLVHHALKQAAKYGR
jgi:hypothetical protein